MIPWANGAACSAGLGLRAAATASTPPSPAQGWLQGAAVPAGIPRLTWATPGESLPLCLPSCPKAQGEPPNTDPPRGPSATLCCCCSPTSPGAVLGSAVFVFLHCRPSRINVRAGQRAPNAPYVSFLPGAELFLAML